MNVMGYFLMIFAFAMGNDGIKLGDKLPLFNLIDQDSKEVRIADFIGTGPLVIYFYPKDDTPGCTMEACSFRDQFAEFEDYGAKIFGISADSPESHHEFRRKYNLPYTLLSDPDKKIQQLFGVKKNFLGLIDGRVTYIIDKRGVVVHIFESQIRPKKHITEALNILKELNKR